MKNQNKDTIKKFVTFSKDNQISRISSDKQEESKNRPPVKQKEEVTITKKE